MTTISDLLETLERLDVPFEAAESIHDSRETIVEKQRDQLLHGIRANGKMIGKYRSKVYAAKKFAQNPLAGFGNMDWKLEGDVHRDLFVDVREDIYIIDSADSKTGDLIERFGDPFGLTEESQVELIDERLEEAFLDRMHNATGL